MNEAFSIFDISNGALSYKDLLAMAFDEFDSIVDKVKEIQDNIKANNNKPTED